jgi:RNA polymerase sigma-70 factor (ECF subfamily)
MNDATQDRADPPGHAAGGLAAPALPLDDEAELVQRAKSDPAAFGQLYEAHYQPILNYLYRQTLSVTVAEELTSDTFFKALRGLPGYRPRPSVRFRAWLYRIATNEARMYWRSRRGRGRTLPLSDEHELPRITFVWPETESPEVVREKQRQYAVMYQALGRLPERYRVALMLRYFEGLGHEEIAGILGTRPGTIKSLVHRGLAKLAKVMTGPGATV